MTWNIRRPLAIRDLRELIRWLDELRAQVVLRVNNLTTSVANLQTTASDAWYTNAEPGVLVSGMPVYVSADKTVTRADGRDATKMAAGFVTNVSSDLTRVKIKLIGFVANVPIAAGASFTFGTKAYLSTAVIASVTHTPQSDREQLCGIALASDDGTYVDLLIFLESPAEGEEIR